jgi:hypothetical protein
MRTATRGILVAILGVSFAGAVGAQTTAAPQPRDSVKLALIHELLSRTHAVDQAVSLMEATVPAQKLANPRIPGVFWDRFLAEARSRRGELEEMMGSVYDKHFSSDELRQLLAFYRTPVGQKVLSTAPTITQESVMAGQAWGQRIGAAVGAQLDAEGVHIKP